MELPNLLGQERTKEIEDERNTYPANMIWIGIGNAGMKLLDKVCSLDTEDNLYEICPIGIRASKFDCQSPRNIEKDQITDLGERRERKLIKGTGGNQSLAQEMFLKEKENILEKIDQSVNKNTLFLLLGSLAGGTGGGGIPVLNKLLKRNFPENPLLVAGILPGSNEGSMFQANASRSLLLLEGYDALILLENRSIRSATIEEGFDLLNDEFARTLYSLFAVRPEEYSLNPQEMLNLIEKFGKRGICLVHRHVSGKIKLKKPKTEMEKEVLKSDIISLLRLNLSYYPEEVLESAKGGAYHIGSNRSFLLHDLMSLLNIAFKDLLSSNQVYIAPGFWDNRHHYIEIVTMLLGIDPPKYKALRRIKEEWKILYEDDDIEKERKELLEI